MPLPQLSEYTAEDYWALPDGQRAELIDGELYDMAPPTVAHQSIVTELARRLGNAVEQAGGPCKVLVSPVAVNLSADDSTYVEPDVIVVCDPSKLSDRGCEGAPDLIVEVVSPSSRKMDYLTKAALYSEARVREYWVIDPPLKRTTVYRYDIENLAPLVYPFAVPVPVGIWGGTPAITVAELL